MKASRSCVAVLLTAAVLIQLSPHAKACGPETLQPLFVMRDSPDPPFTEFTQGNIGILKPSFGRKTLVIAYRYLNGGSFTAQEQEALVDALKGTQPESDTEQKVKEWIEARKLVVKEENELPEVYRESRWGDYDFFPNCTSNAFEVATQTLRDRATRFGADNNDVHEWLRGQDTVFRNCSDSQSLPTALGPERSDWLRKDRDYQIAASFFYSLQLDEAVKRFEQISQDNESEWQKLADYLVGRALVRKASLERAESSKLDANQKAEAYLVGLSGRAGKYGDATRKLLGLVRYRLRPEERVRELAQILTLQSGSIDLRQDLIDYVWLLDKFDAQIKKQEEERQKLLNPQKTSSEFRTNASPGTQETANEPPRPDEVNITIHSLNAAGQIDYATGQTFRFKPDTSIAEVLKTIEKGLGRKLTEQETRYVNDQHSMALNFRRRERSPNRKLNTYDYEGCSYGCEKVPLSMYPAFVTADDLSDWVVTFQSKDPEAYSGSLKKWRETQSPAWFVTSLVKAKKTSPSVSRLLSHAEQIQPEMPMYATVAYHRIRLLIELGQKKEALQLLNQVIERALDTFPVSAQNEFMEQRMNLAEGLSTFLRFALRKPIAFYLGGQLGSIKEVLDPEAYDGDEIPEQDRQWVKRMIEWDGRAIFDERAADILNWHFSASALMNMSRDPALPDYFRQRVLLSAWTRAILLKNDVIAGQAAGEIARTIPDNADLFRSYLHARTPAERDAAATFALLKLPDLSPYFSEGVPDNDTGLIPDPIPDYASVYYGMAWWCVLPQTDYDMEAQQEIPKEVISPPFLTPELLNAAQTERAALIELGDAKSFLGKRAIAWAKLSPNDTRVPEALFIAVLANESYKYGCGGWEHDEEIRKEAASLLKEKYPNSKWAVMLREMDQN